MIKTTTIKGLDEIVERYDFFILDQWGVMHDGKQGYPCAIDCINNLVKLNKKLIIISNSSKRKKNTISRLPSLGFNQDNFFETMTSGEMIWQSLLNLNHDFTKKLNKNCFHLYDKNKEDGKLFLQGLEKYNFVENIEQADFILGCTPYANYSIMDYIPLLKKAINKQLPFVCANPDFDTVENKSKNLLICMGSIAELYKSMGGKIFILGKPCFEIYNESIKKINNFEKSKTLAIGDSIYHDIAGANSFGVDSLLITSGIHKGFFDKDRPIWDSKSNKLIKLDIKPTFICSNFKN